jgi:oligopeptide/dipeptide ABC transporter ATP-binding protein
VIEEQRHRIILEGDVPSPANPPQGCNFNTRCPLATDVCQETEPEFKQKSPDHWVACHVVD